MKEIRIAVVLFLVFFVSCEQNDSETAQKPKPVLNTSFEPKMGGGTIHYELPDDESIRSVRAEYTLNTGQSISRVSSYFSTTIEIDGFDDTIEHEVKLFSVNYNKVESEPVILKIQTLGSPLKEIVNSFKVLPYFSSVKMTWNNQEGVWVQIVLNIKTPNKDVVQTVYTMDNGLNTMWVNNLAAESYSFSGYTIDRYGNKSEQVELGSIVPLTDYQLDKALWTHVPDEELPEGKENADLIFQEGRLSKFYDDVIDDKTLHNLNFMYSSKGFPFSYFIDLGRTVKASRVKVWQREEHPSYESYFYQFQNVKIFELWISKDKINWEQVRRATIVEPSNSAFALEEAKEGHEFIIYEDDPHFTPEFRYLEFRGIETFGMADQYACLSEITLFGIEENDF